MCIFSAKVGVPILEVFKQNASFWESVLESLP
jgi:hypothetical protein